MYILWVSLSIKGKHYNFRIPSIFLSFSMHEAEQPSVAIVNSYTLPHLFVEVVATKKVVTLWVAEFVLVQDSEPLAKFIVRDPSTHISPPSKTYFTLYSDRRQNVNNLSNSGVELQCNWPERRERAMLMGSLEKDDIKDHCSRPQFKISGLPQRSGTCAATRVTPTKTQKSNNFIFA